MNTSTRLGTTVLTAAALIGALAGCATGAAVSAPTASGDTATTTSVAPTPTPTPSPSAATAADVPPTQTPTPVTSAPSLAQHVFDACSTEAAENGVTLTFTPDPSGSTSSDGSYQLIYPFTFDDGHTDPYAIYNCTLTDDTITSSYVKGGLGDAH
jgi:hypothetical protein